MLFLFLSAHQILYYSDSYDAAILFIKMRTAKWHSQKINTL